MKKSVLIFAMSMILICQIGQIQAAEIWCDSREDKEYAERLGLPPTEKPYCSVMYLKGQIVPGDFAAFKSKLRANEPYVALVGLFSPGGDIQEALKIGALIRERMLTTLTGFRAGDRNVFLSGVCTENCHCASACFFIWSAGIERSGNALIVHRPHNISGTFGRKRAAAASSEYTALLGSVGNYLLQMDVPAAIIADMNAISSNNASYVPRQQIETYLEGYVPGIHEWLITDCGALSQQEDDDWDKLAMKGSNRTSSDEAYYNLINQKRDTIRLCQFRKIARERMRLVKDSPL
jgi:hypothetical protein